MTYRPMISAVSENELQTLRQHIATGFVDHMALASQSTGLEGFKSWARSAREALPELAGTVEDLLADGHKIAGRVTGKEAVLATSRDCQPQVGPLRSLPSASSGARFGQDAPKLSKPYGLRSTTLRGATRPLVGADGCCQDPPPDAQLGTTLPACLDGSGERDLHAAAGPL